MEFASFFIIAIGGALCGVKEEGVKFFVKRNVIIHEDTRIVATSVKKKAIVRMADMRFVCPGSRAMVVPFTSCIMIIYFYPILFLRALVQY